MLSLAPARVSNNGLPSERLLMDEGMRSTLAVLLIALALFGCGRHGANSPVASKKDHSAARPAMDLAQLGERLAIREYRIEAAGNATTLRVVLENLQETDPLSFGARASFHDSSNTEVVKTEWTRIDIAAGARHQYLAKTIHPEAESARLELLPVEDLPQQ